MSNINNRCQYHDPDGLVCKSEANSSVFCYWHDKLIDKSDTAVKTALEAYIKNGGLVSSICLKRAALSGVYLVNHHHKAGHDLSYADLYHADLTDAHMFNIKLDNASLMKADLRGANLNCASLVDTNLLGAKWSNAKIENIGFGNKLIQEQKAHQCLKEKKHQRCLRLF